MASEYSAGWKDACAEMRRRAEEQAETASDVRWLRWAAAMSATLAARPGMGRNLAVLTAAVAAEREANYQEGDRRWCMARTEHAPHWWHDYYHQKNFECRGKPTT